VQWVAVAVLQRFNIEIDRKHAGRFKENLSILRGGLPQTPQQRRLILIVRNIEINVLIDQPRHLTLAPAAHDFSHQVWVLVRASRLHQTPFLGMKPQGIHPINELGRLQSELLLLTYVKITDKLQKGPLTSLTISISLLLIRLEAIIFDFLRVSINRYQASAELSEHVYNICTLNSGLALLLRWVEVDEPLETYCG